MPPACEGFTVPRETDEFPLTKEVCQKREKKREEGHFCVSGNSILGVTNQEEIGSQGEGSAF